MAAKKSAQKKMTKSTAVAAKANSAGTKPTPTERAEKAESRAKRLENQVDKLKALDKVGVHKQFSGFMGFLREQSVVGLAIGLVLGTQAKVLVDQIIASFINPIVGLLLPGQGTLKDKIFTVNWNGKTAQFGWGAFVLSLLTFVIVAAVVYYVFKGLKLDKLDKKKED
ncbi:MAG: MscL family protein [Candidatus Saccharimonadales bacterium]